MDMPQIDAVDAEPLRFRGQRLLEIADEIDGVLDLQFRPGRQRPVVRNRTRARRRLKCALETSAVS